MSGVTPFGGSMPASRRLSRGKGGDCSKAGNGSATGPGGAPQSGLSAAANRRFRPCPRRPVARESARLGARIETKHKQVYKLRRVVTSAPHDAIPIMATVRHSDGPVLRTFAGLPAIVPPTLGP